MNCKGYTLIEAIIVGFCCFLLIFGFSMFATYAILGFKTLSWCDFNPAKCVQQVIHPDTEKKK